MTTQILPGQARPDQATAEALFAGERWGDTKQSVEAILDDWQERFMRDRQVFTKRRQEASGGGQAQTVIRYDAQGNRIQ
jgi:hypothetical protein